jgi:hypothetical protein
MGVGKSMKTFISAMTEQTGMGGYGPKIKSTPMGPFRWNDLTQLWENVNNGMVMNNVSFQDMFMMGYETNNSDNGTPGGSQGGNPPPIICNYATNTVTTWTVSIEEGPGNNDTSPTSPAFTNTCSILLTSEAIDANANNLIITTSINGGAFNSHTLGTSITIPPDATLAINIDANTAATGNARFRFKNSSSVNEIVWGINSSITPAPP